MAYRIENPLGSGNDTLESLLSVLTGRLMEIVIPIAVLLYLWAGVNMLIAAGRAEYVTRAKTIFKNTTIGLLIIFIGGGFVDLIRSILNAGQ